MAELFDYRNMESSAVDVISGGLNGIRLPDTGLPAITAQEYRIFVEATGKARSDVEAKGREIHRRLSVTLASQMLSLLGTYGCGPFWMKIASVVIMILRGLQPIPHSTLQLYCFCQMLSYFQTL